MPKVTLVHSSETQLSEHDIEVIGDCLWTYRDELEDALEKHETTSREYAWIKAKMECIDGILRKIGRECA